MLTKQEQKRLLHLQYQLYKEKCKLLAMRILGGVGNILYKLSLKCYNLSTRIGSD